MTKIAISGFVIGGVMGGLATWAYGGDSREIWDSIVQGALWGAVTNLALYALISLVNWTVVKVANANARKQLYAELARQATHNPSSRNVVIGKYDNNAATGYINVANKSNSTYFDIADYEGVKQLIGAKNVWKINKAFLNQQIALNKTFSASHSIINQTGSYAKEIAFLTKKGINIIPLF